MRLAFSIGHAWALTYVTLAIVLLGGAVLAAFVALAVTAGPFDMWFVLAALATYAGGGLIIVARIGGYHPFPRFGAANVVTLARFIITCLFTGLVLETGLSSLALSASMAWVAFAFAVLSLVLDGVDGYFARRQGLASRFGSRFDMETDALLIFLLSIAALTFEKAGAWVLLGGVLRYMYVVASWLWPVLNEPLRPSWRRKAVSVIQGGVLAALLAPIIVPPFSTAVAAIALVLLVYSFGQDVFYHMRGPTAGYSHR
jgi:phosphatidylglycerophosphate synthase